LTRGPSLLPRKPSLPRLNPQPYPQPCTLVFEDYSIPVHEDYSAQGAGVGVIERAVYWVASVTEETLSPVPVD
jgi:hypothetical protein